MAFSAMPTIDAIARDVRVMCALPTANVMPSVNPRPQTRMVAPMIRFLELEKSTLFSTMFLTPIAEIIP